MTRKNPQPETAAAKAEAGLMAQCRRDYPDFDAEVVRFGLLVALYNAGWLAGSESERKKRRPRHAPPGMKGKP